MVESSSASTLTSPHDAGREGTFDARISQRQAREHHRKILELLAQPRRRRPAHDDVPEGVEGAEEGRPQQAELASSTTKKVCDALRIAACFTGTS